MTETKAFPKDRPICCAAYMLAAGTDNVIEPNVKYWKCVNCGGETQDLKN